MTTKDMTTRLRSPLVRGLVIALLAGVTGGALALRRAVARPATASGDGGDAARVPTAVVRERELTPRVLSTGSVRLLPGARIDVGARVSGVVTSLPVTQGSRVARGAVIARLDDREGRARLAEADASVAELTAAARQQSEELARAEALAATGAASPRDLLAARTALATTRARLDGARAARALAQLELDYTVIRAPIAGIVASVSTEEGETVAASLAAPTFVTLLDPTRIECIALVDETDIGRVHVGDRAEFTVDAYPGRTFRGTVVSIAPDATLIGGVIDYEVHVQIAGDTRDLKPQMTATVSIAAATTRALVVPSAAVRQSALGTFVWRRRGGAVERVNVVLGAREPDMSEIRSGLAAGDTVLTGGFPEEP
jgi:HlyD family secretion protein